MIDPVIGGATAREIIPDEIQVLFGKPPVLYNENPGHYLRLLSKIALAIKPKDIIEWFWVKDVTDFLWEILRLRRIKALILNHGQKKALAHLFRIAIDDGESPPLAAYRRGDQLAHDFLEGDATAKSEARALFEQKGFDEESSRAQAFSQQIETLEIADRLLAAAEIRRDKVLREIDLRRETLGRRMREIIAAESDKALRLPGPKDENNNQVLDEPPPPATAKGA